MNKEENIDGELDESFLDNKLKENPFTIPTNYFDDLYEQTIAQKNLMDLDFKNKDFNVADNYFENSKNQILSKIILDDVLDNTSIKEDFKVPTNYFNTLSNSILENTTKKPQAAIRKMHFFRYAAAVLILISSSLIIFNYQNQNSVNHKLSTIPEEEIVDYLRLHSDAGDVSLIIENIDDVGLIEAQIGKEIKN
jgi:hypothetical protein